MSSNDEEAAARVIQHTFRKWLAACGTASAAAGKTAEGQDATNRKRLNEWVEQKVKDAKQKDLAKHNGSRQQYRSHLEWKAATRLAEAQQKRTRAVRGGRSSSVRAWLPGTMAPVYYPHMGATLESSMSLQKGDVVLVEQVKVAAAPTPTLTDQSTDRERHECWSAQLAAFAAADATTRARVLKMHKSDTGGGGASASPGEGAEAAAEGVGAGASGGAGEGGEGGAGIPPARLQRFQTILKSICAHADGPEDAAEAAALAAFAARHAGTELATAAKQVPLVFRGNAVQNAKGRAVLPIIGSLFSHSCNPNTIRALDAPKEGEVEFVATRGIGRKEEITVSYIGHQLWPRARRQEHLKLSKGFNCECVRCNQPDLEAPLPCPACSPLKARVQGFCAPQHGASSGSSSKSSSRPGYIAHHPMVYTFNDGSATAGKWVCDVNREHVFTTEDLKAIALPEGAPAPTYHGLLAYADALGEGLSEAPVEMLASEEVVHYAQALVLTVGQYHWAAQMANIRSLQSLSPDGSPGVWSIDHVQSAAEAAVEWVRDWLGLEPAFYIGPAALLNAAAVLINAGRVLPAVKLWKLVLEATPAQSPVHATAGQLLATVQAEVDAASAGGGGI